MHAGPVLSVTEPVSSAADSSVALHSKLTALELELLRSLSSSQNLGVVAQQWTELVADVAERKRRNRIDAATMSLAARVAARLQVISQTFIGCAEHVQSERMRATTELQDFLQPGHVTDLSQSTTSKPTLQPRRVPSSRPSTNMAPARNTSSDSSSDAQLNSSVLRSWFRKNLADPFPSKEQKEAIVAETNATSPAPANVASTSQRTVSGSSSSSTSETQLRYEQVMLWFINARRRAGWTEFYRNHAKGKKERMVELISALEAEATGKPANLDRFFNTTPEGRRFTKFEVQAQADACRAGYRRMIDWIEQSGREKVGDWLDQVISEAKAELKKNKAAKNAVLEASGCTLKARPTRRVARLPKSRAAPASPATLVPSITIASPSPVLDKGTSTPPPFCATFNFAMPILQIGTARVASSDSLLSATSDVPSLIGGAHAGRRRSSSISTSSSEASFDAQRGSPPTATGAAKSPAHSFSTEPFHPVAAKETTQKSTVTAVSPASEADDSGHSISGLEPYSPLQRLSSLQLRPEEELCAAHLLQGIPEIDFSNEGPLERIASMYKSVSPSLDGAEGSFVDFPYDAPSEAESSLIKESRAQILNAALGGEIVGVFPDWSARTTAFLDAGEEPDSIAEYLAPSPQ